MPRYQICMRHSCAGIYRGLSREPTTVLSTMRPIPAIRFRGNARHEESLAARTPLTLRLRVLFRRGALDRELAEGCPPDAVSDRGLRARQLTEPASCRRLAASLRSCVEDAENPRRGGFSSAIPVRRDVVLIWRDAFLNLAERLERPAAVSATGVARVLRLLTEGGGPLYDPCSERLMGDVLCWVAEGFSECPPHCWRCPVIMKLDPAHVAWTCARCGAIALSEGKETVPSASWSGDA